MAAITEVLFERQPQPTARTINAVVQVKWPDSTGNQVAKRIVICLDTSGSMDSFGKLRTAKSAIDSIVAAIPDHYELGVVTFNNVASIIQPLGIKRPLTLNTIHAAGNTNMGDGLQTVARMIREAPTVLETTVLVLTDGQVNEGLARTETALARLVLDLPAVQFRILGVGQDYNEQFLQMLTQQVPNGLFQHCTDTQIAENIGEVVGLCLETVGTNIAVGVQWNGAEGTLCCLGDPLRVAGTSSQVLEFRQPIAPGGGTTYFTFGLTVGTVPSSLTVKVVYTLPTGRPVEHEATFPVPPLTLVGTGETNPIVLANVLRLQVLAKIHDLTLQQPAPEVYRAALNDMLQTLRDAQAADQGLVGKLIQLCESLHVAVATPAAYKMCAAASSAMRCQSNGVYLSRNSRNTADIFQQTALITADGRKTTADVVTTSATAITTTPATATTTTPATAITTTPATAITTTPATAITTTPATPATILTPTRATMW